jgi:hypothetical protein
MVIWIRLLDTRRIPDLTGTGMRMIFLPVGDTRNRPELRQVRDIYFFSPAGNPMGIRYFTTVIIIGCEQVKICLFYYINYDLF